MGAFLENKLSNFGWAFAAKAHFTGADYQGVRPNLLGLENVKGADFSTGTWTAAVVVAVAETAAAIKGAGATAALGSCEGRDHVSAGPGAWATIGTGSAAPGVTNFSGDTVTWCNFAGTGASGEVEGGLVLLCPGKGVAAGGWDGRDTPLPKDGKPAGTSLEDLYCEGGEAGCGSGIKGDWAGTTGVGLMLVMGTASNDWRATCSGSGVQGWA
jgi:hypothetical protein